MKIEIVEYYPCAKKTSKQRLLGTLHMYLIDEEMDLRGVRVYKTPTGYFIQPPSFIGPDDVRYGCIAFTNQEKQDDFMKTIIREGNHYLKSLK